MNFSFRLLPGSDRADECVIYSAQMARIILTLSLLSDKYFEGGTKMKRNRGIRIFGFAKAICEVDAPGLGPADLTTLPYKNVPKDLYPFTSVRL